MTQTERVILAAKSFRGVSQVDFLGPDTVDGKPPITRLAARIFDAERKGHVFEIIGWRQSCKVYRWVEGPEVERGGGVEGPALSDAGAPSRQATPSLSSGVESGARGINGVGTRGDLDASLPNKEGALPNQVQASTDATPSLALDSGVERGTGHAHVAQDHVGVSSAGVALSPGKLFEVGPSQYGFADQEQAA